MGYEGWVVVRSHFLNPRVAYYLLTTYYLWQYLEGPPQLQPSEDVKDLGLKVMLNHIRQAPQYTLAALQPVASSK
jgi:hypothetical protein